MSSKNIKFLVAGVIVIIILLGIFIFTQEPFRNDTDRYLQLKREAWSSIQSAGKDNAKIEQAFDKLNTDLNLVKCTKVDDTYRKECDTLKYKVTSVIDAIKNPTTNKDSYNQGAMLAQDIANILKN